MNEQRESLESLLSKAPHIDDDGFTEALMTRLPPAARPCGCGRSSSSPPRWRPAAWWQRSPGLGAFSRNSASPSSALQQRAGSSLFTVGIVVALLVWGAMAAASSEA